MRHIFTLVLACTSAFWATAAAASPVYLECTHALGENGKSRALAVTLVESDSSVTYSTEGGRSEKTDAAFTATDVTFRHVWSLGFTDTLTKWVVNRSTLALTREETTLYYGGPKEGAREVSVETGVCKLANPPADRKF